MYHDTPQPILDMYHDTNFVIFWCEYTKIVPCFNESVPYLIEFSWKIAQNNFSVPIKNLEKSSLTFSLTRTQISNNFRHFEKRFTWSLK